MSVSPLQFAREWEQFTAEIAHATSDEHRLLVALDIWPRLQEVGDRPQYASYRDEYLGLLPRVVTGRSLADLSVEELECTRRTLEDVAQAAPDAAVGGLADLVCFRLASLLCWLGEPERAVEAIGAAPPDLSESEDRPHEAQRLLMWYIRETPTDHSASATLQRILDEWQGYLDAVWDDRINCLLVDYQGGKPRGRMRSLTGVVEPRGSRRRKEPGEDHVAVDSQLKSADDPFAGVIYKALKAVRTELHRSGMTRTYRDQALSADFFLGESHVTLTGDSVGLSAALIAYAQLLKPEVMRHEKYVSGGIAVTGAIDEQGNALPVSEESLAAKVTRAFHSPVSALVVPQEHVEVAAAVIAELQQRHPHRELEVIGARHLSRVVQDRNVIRSEKVCMGQYVVRTVNKYTRATKVQVPVLLVLGYLLLCLLYPRAWIGFDRNPAEVEIITSGFIIRNADGHELWRQTYPWELNKTRSADDGPFSSYLLADLDDDGRNEVLLLPVSNLRKPVPAGMENQMYAYDDDHTLLFVCTLSMLHEYPGDTSAHFLYDMGHISLIPGRHGLVLHTSACASNMARAHNKFWSLQGELLGWYVTSGFVNTLTVLGEDTVALYGYNNRLGKAQVSIVQPTQVAGVGPPHDGPLLANLRRAEHVACVVFPGTDIRHASATRYSIITHLRRTLDAGCQVVIAETRHEATKSWYNTVGYYFNTDFRVSWAACGDPFVSFRDSLVRAGDLPAIPWDVYNDSLARAVEYWTDSGWVSEGQLRDAEAALSASK